MIERSCIYVQISTNYNEILHYTIHVIALTRL